MSSFSTSLDRRSAVATLLQNRGNALVVSGLGSSSYDVHAAGDLDANFYLWGAMGSAALVGCGLAQSRPDCCVWVITGDGEQLMGLGGLATIGAANVKNLTILVIDNEHFGETGMQPSHTGKGVDLTSIAAACGFVTTGAIRDGAGLASISQELAAKRNTGPKLFVVKVATANSPRSLPPRDAVYVKNRFRRHLGLSAS